jgi:hypothetical protein
MVKFASILVCASLLVVTPVVAEGPLAVVSSVRSSVSRGANQGPVHLNLIARPNSVAKDDEVYFEGFLAQLGTDRKPQPMESVVPRGAKRFFQPKGEGAWQLQLANADPLSLTGIEQKGPGLNSFFGKTNYGGPFSVAVIDDPTGIEEAILIIAGASLVICSTVYIYDSITKNCAEKAEKDCGGKEKVKSMHPKGLRIFTANAGLDCHLDCGIECIRE